MGQAAQAEAGATEEERLAALDAKLDELMGAVRLAYLVAREGGWDASASWGNILSLGKATSTATTAAPCWAACQG